MPPLTHGTTSAPRRHGRESGFVMLVVMVILLVATASAAVAIQSTQAELRAAGQERQAAQTRYVAEAGLMTTLTYLDMVTRSGDLPKITRVFAFPNPAPAMNRYAEPEYSFNTVTGEGGTRHGAFRIGSRSQREVNVQEVDEIPVISEAVGTGGSGGGGGTGGSTSFVDAYGSLGPSQAYTPLDDDDNTYVADVNDCIDVKNATAGNQVGHGQTIVLHCTITIRARTQLDLNDNQASILRHSWTMAGQTDAFRQNPFTTAHDMRASVTLPAMLNN